MCSKTARSLYFWGGASIRTLISGIFGCFAGKIYKTKAAFTLAEVLITLGIIGVIAAMTIPSLMNKINEAKTVNKLKATYSILTQATKLMIDNEGDISCWGLKSGTNNDSYNQPIIGSYYKRYLKISEDCGLKDTNNKCFPSIYRYKNGRAYWADMSDLNYYYKVRLANGAAVSFNLDGNTDKLLIRIDVNGPGNPNVIGKDLFELRYDPDTTSFYPHGDPNKVSADDDYRQSCLTAAGSGWGCAYYIFQNGKMNYPNGY